ncbi:MAG: hypothetical protein M9918_24275 [Anaerolineae bacterium]|nr:hypothetical protein [Anaerolineae bacterium]
MGILDRIVTNYTEDDIEQLGENIVLILDTLKEMTQPELMRLLRSSVIELTEEDLCRNSSSSPLCASSTIPAYDVG